MIRTPAMKAEPTIALAHIRDDRQGDELVPVRNSIDPIIGQVRVLSHYGVPGTDLRSMNMSETTRRNRPMEAPDS